MFSLQLLAAGGRARSTLSSFAMIYAAAAMDSSPAERRGARQPGEVRSEAAAVHEAHALLDGRCVAADLCPKGQGFYHRAVLAEGLPATGETAELRLRVVPRANDGNGTEFSLVTVIAEV